MAAIARPSKIIIRIIAESGEIAAASPLNLAIIPIAFELNPGNLWAKWLLKKNPDLKAHNLSPSALGLAFVGDAPAVDVADADVRAEAVVGSSPPRR